MNVDHGLPKGELLGAPSHQEEPEPFARSGGVAAAERLPDDHRALLCRWCQLPETD